MRVPSALIPVVVLALAAAISTLAARAAVVVVEDRSADAVEEALHGAGQDWAAVVADGLQVVVEGEAPTEAARFRAIAAAGTVVDAARVIDNMSVADAEAIAPPEFSVEILRNDSGVSLIGLMPAAGDRDAVAARVQDLAGDAPLADFLEQADYAAPAGWTGALDYALDALDELPRAKVSVTPARVAITAITDSAAEKRRLESALRRRAPAGLDLVLDVSAPRPVISPFTTRFMISAEGAARFDACAADSDEAAARILAAAKAAGMDGDGTCTVGLGTPSGTWGDAVALSIGALSDLGGGTMTASDADITLVALEGTQQAVFDRVVGELENALPDLFALDAVLPVTPEQAPQGPPEFTATLTEEGVLELRGRIKDALMNDTVENFADARFGEARVAMGTRVVDDLPAGWGVRVLASLEALSKLAHGRAVVTPDSVSIAGETGQQEASAEISRLLIEKLGQSGDFEIDVVYREELDPIAALPTPEECLRQITSVTSRSKITFDPGSATIAGAAQGTVDAIAEILRRCADLRIEIGGYTDSQGREEMNQRLSQQRAEAVLTALRARRVPVGSFLAVGYGEADPIADNGTAEGREANRRIEFRLIRDDPVPGEDAAAGEAAESGDADAGNADEQEAETE